MFVVTKAKYDKVVSLKEDLQVKLKRCEDALCKIRQNCYEQEQEIQGLEESNESLYNNLQKERKDKQDFKEVIDILESKIKLLEKENSELGDRLVKTNHLLFEKDKELQVYKEDRKRIDALKAEYKWHLDEAIKLNMISPELTREDIKKLISHKGIKCIVDFNMLFSLL